MNMDENNNASSGDDRKMYPAKCSECGKDCEVPFEPTEGKPVKCKECYIKGRPPRRSFGGDRRPREMHDAKCGNCGKDCQVPFKPSGDKPVLCMDCFKKSKE